ncbi:cohesin domain-containing protein [Microbacterium halophytorum]|uniref:cohesin domain-containing protein n=1 Tax=Microbacterium halophytorum TaxID=2067568 RepID=UPI001319E34F|nr:cohesin domain-containing protein [Microbacterium halophytorum]
MHISRGSAPSQRRRRAAAVAVGIAAAGAALLGSGPALAAPAQVGAVELSAPATGEVGEVVDVAIEATGAADVYAAEFALAFDDEVLKYIPDSAVFLDGGYGAANEESGAAQLAYTRLGSSPGVSGDATVATVSFEVMGAGDATVSIDGGTLVGTEGEQQPLGAVEAVTISVADDAGADPTNPDDPGGTGDDQPTDGGDGADDPASTDGSGDSSSDDAASDGPGEAGSDEAASDDGELAVTGGTIAGAGIAVVVAAGAIVTGIVLVRRRREGVA